jgi:protein-disulfide isomerase
MSKRLLIFAVILTACAVATTVAQTNNAAGRNEQTSTGSANVAKAAAAKPEGEAVESCGCEANRLPEVLAIVNGVRVTAGEIEARVKKRVLELQRQVIEARKRELDLQINSRLLEAEAKKRGSSTIKVIEEEIIAKVKDPTETEALAFYEQNKSRIRAEFKDVKGDIINHLRTEREREEAQKFAGRLRAAAQVKVLTGSVTPPVVPADRARVFATVNNEPLTSADIEDSLRPLIYSVQEQVYSLRRRELELIINDTLLEQEAQKRKMTTNALLDAEVGSKIKQVTEAKARAFYEQNRERLNGDFAQLKEQITRYLQEREVRNAQTAFAAQMQRAASIQTFLTAPDPPVYTINTDDQPSLGNATAPVTIVEFMDYQCPSCAATQPVIEKLVREYDGRVRLVVRDFPLGQHADAFKAAEAAEAAREQGKYWEYAALLMRNQSKLSVAMLKEYASQAALDRRKFDAALDSGKFSDKVQRDIRDGARLGVNATPTLFINGRRVSETTYESLKAAVENALKEVGKSGQAP